MDVAWRQDILNGRYKRIILVTGAGVSSNAGIPCPVNTAHGDKEMIYDDAFWHSVHTAVPTSSHKFAKLLEDMGVLVRIYTQNIDELYEKAGVSSKFIIHVHGSVTAGVINRGSEVPPSSMLKASKDFICGVDLVIVMGTSLQISPFCAIPNMAHRKCARLLIDLCPSNCFKNAFNQPFKDWSLPYFMNSPFLKVNGMQYKLSQHWDGSHKWRTQHITSADCDAWCSGS